MDHETKRTLGLANALAKRGMTFTSVHATTPDGRIWLVLTVPAGRGRFPDGHWGPKVEATGGFRLFELSGGRLEHHQEHDAVDGDVWDAGDLADYINAIGQPKAQPKHKPSR